MSGPRESDPLSGQRLIRDLTHSDVEEAISLWRDSDAVAHPFLPDFRDGEAVTMREVLLAHTGGRVIRERGEMKGFSYAGGVHIYWLYIERNSRRGGYGKALLDDLKGSHDRLSLEVFVLNRDAVAFYLSQGFQEGEQLRPVATCEKVRMTWAR